MSSPAAGTPECPVYFCGTPGLSHAFDAFSEASAQDPAILARQIASLAELSGGHLPEIQHGVLVLLLATKDDLVTILQVLTALRSRLEEALRVLVFNIINHEKIPDLLEAKGCSETLRTTLSPKSLRHKLQKTMVISAARRREMAMAEGLKPATELSRAPVPAAPAVAPEADPWAGLAFVAALEEPNDCWLVRNKKDFKFVRGLWMGEMVGPGPSAGVWSEVLPRQGSELLFQWDSRCSPDPFVPGDGKWYFAGRKPEFLWETNRWLFVGKRPRLYYRGNDLLAEPRYRFLSPGEGMLELAVNSEAAKSKLKLIVATFAEATTIRSETGAGGDKVVVGDDAAEPDTPVAEALDDEWKEGAGAFEQLGLELSMRRAGGEGGAVALLEREATEWLVEADAGEYAAGEKVVFAARLGTGDRRRRFEVLGEILSSEPSDGERVLVKVAVAEGSAPALDAIQAAFETRQERLLRFLQEAKGG